MLDPNQQCRARISYTGPEYATAQISYGVKLLLWALFVLNNSVLQRKTAVLYEKYWFCFEKMFFVKNKSLLGKTHGLDHSQDGTPYHTRRGSG